MSMGMECRSIKSDVCMCMCVWEEVVFSIYI